MTGMVTLEIVEELAGMWPANMLDESEGEWECRFCNYTSSHTPDTQTKMLADPEFAATEIVHYFGCIWIRAAAFVKAHS